MKRLRRLPFGTYDPAYNMALDAVLLRRAGAGESPPTFRLYGWNRPALSLGRSQRQMMDDLDLYSGQDAFAAVMRPTGGAVAVHGRDLSYALAVPFPCEFLPPRPKACYGAIHGALADALRRLGCDVQRVDEDHREDYRAKVYCSLTLSACDIVSGGRKIVGSAQRVLSGALLQHGFILLDEDFGWVRRLLGPAGEKVARASTTLKDILPGDRALDAGRLRSAILDALGQALGVQLREEPLSSEEEKAVEELRREQDS